MIFGDTAHVLAGHQGGEAEYDALFDAAMAAAQVGIFIHQDGRFKYANAHLLQLIGYSADELIDRMGPLDLLAPGEQALFPAAPCRGNGGHLQPSIRTFGSSQGWRIDSCQSAWTIHPV